MAITKMKQMNLNLFKTFHLKTKLMFAGLINLILLNILLLIFLDNPFYQIILCALNILVWSGNLIVAAFSKNINLPYKIMTIYGLTSTSLHAFGNGGLYSSYLFWLPLICLGMSIFLNQFYAIISLIYSALVYVFFLWLQMSGRFNFQEQIMNVPPLLDFINYISVLLMLYLIHYFFFSTLNLNLIWKKENEMKVGDLELKLNAKESEVMDMRRNMAQDFHDEMGNKLASISILSQSLNEKLKKEFPNSYLDESRMLDLIHQTVLDVYEGTKDFIWSVDYKSDFALELFIYLREFGESFFNNLDINFISDYKVDTDIPYKLNPLYGRQIVFVCKEVMTNAVKHSRCDDFTFCFELEKQNTLKITLSDNGIGFDNSKLTKVRGLSNIEERCKFCCINYHVESDLKGTCYTLFLEVSKDTIPPME